jgi:hypothetical protein
VLFWTFSATGFCVGRRGAGFERVAGGCDWRGFLPVAGRESAFARGEGKQGWVELDESRVDGGVFGVAGVAFGRTRNHFGRCGVAKTEEGPFAGEAGFVFHVDLETHGVCALEVARLVDGALAFGAAAFENEHGFVGPSAGLEESLVGLAVDENVVKHVVVHIHRGVVAHIEAGGEVDPFAIVLGKTELAFARVLRAGTRRGIRVQTESCDGEENRSAEERDFQIGSHGGEYGAVIWGRLERWLQGVDDWLHFGVGTYRKERRKEGFVRSVYCLPSAGGTLRSG